MAKQPENREKQLEKLALRLAISRRVQDPAKVEHVFRQLKDFLKADPLDDSVRLYANGKWYDLGNDGFYDLVPDVIRNHCLDDGNGSKTTKKTESDEITALRKQLEAVNAECKRDGGRFESVAKFMRLQRLLRQAEGGAT